MLYHKIKHAFFIAFEEITHSSIARNCCDVFPREISECKFNIK
jgi:hypothetical protein